MATPFYRKKGFMILSTVILLLVALRIALPYIVLRYVNTKLSELEEYTGHVQDIDIALLRGAYVIKNIEIEKRGKSGNTPFFFSPTVDLSVQWNALFKGRIVGEIDVEKPVLSFVKGKHKDEDLKADTADFRQLMKDLMPLTVNQFGINKGSIRYIDPYSSPAVDIGIEDIHVRARNLSNVNKTKELLPATLEASATAYEGKFTLNVRFDGLNKIPTFDLDARVEHVNMVHLNSFFKAYGNFDLKKGNFGLYSEFAARDQAFNGYVKPVISDLDIVQWNKEEGNIPQILWETIIGSTAEVFQNQRKDQLATKIPISGRFDNPNMRLWDAVSYVLRNAFVNALKPSIDETINIANVGKAEPETFLQRVFGKDEKKKK